MREDDFEVYLRNTNLSENTIASYKFAVKQYCLLYTSDAADE